MITVYDHNTHPIWRGLFNQRHASKNRTNGGFTYSEDIVKYHIPVMIPILEQSQYKNILITTVGELESKIVPDNTDLIFCYLHEFLERELPRVERISQWYNKAIIYITSRDNLYHKLINTGYKSILLPMSIDTKQFTKYKQDKYQDNRVIYFGNRYLGKGGSHEVIKQAFLKSGWIFDDIAFNLFNGKDSLTREQIFQTLAKYKYGIGEGRCVLEMNALGIKTLICASKNQGIITNESEFELQKMNNFSDGKVWTFSQDINTCVENFDKAIIKTVDVHEVLPILEKQLKEIIK